MSLPPNTRVCRSSRWRRKLCRPRPASEARPCATTWEPAFRVSYPKHTLRLTDHQSLIPQSGILSGDELVAQTANTYEFPRAQDVSLQLTYPENGKGATVSYVELLCTQDTNEGTAYVVAGGIGQSLISIVLEAKNTKNFSYQALYYGVN